MGKLDGKVAVILGASSIEGLGGVIAKAYANEGAKVVISGRRQEPLDELEAELNGKAQTCDITVDGDIENLFKVAKDTYGKVDIAINTTGMYEPGPLNELTRDHLRKYTEVSFIGPTIFIREAANIMENGGSIITTTSVTVELSAVGLSAYVGTKAATDKIVQIAAKEYQHKGLKINSLSPGLVDTPMTGALFDMDGPIKAMTKESPLGRLANVQDVANTAVWMASDDCFTTGDLIRVSGGIQLNRLPTQEEMYGQ